MSVSSAKIVVMDIIYNIKVCMESHQRRKIRRIFSMRDLTEVKIVEMNPLYVPYLVELEVAPL